MDPHAWPGLDVIRRAMTEVQRWWGARKVVYKTPGLGTRVSAGGCGTRPRALRGRSGLVVSVAVPTDFVGVRPTCTEVTLFRDTSGAIDAALVSGPRSSTAVPGPPDALIAYARGDGPVPPVADEVELYVADVLRTSLASEDAGERESWSPVLDRLTDPVAQSGGAGVTEDSCLVRGTLPAGLFESDAWRLSVPESRECAHDWSVLIWMDDAGAIRAVDLLTGRS